MAGAFRVAAIQSCPVYLDLERTLDKACALIADAPDWINPGESVIVDPDGKMLAGPAREIETILYADIRADQLIGPRWQLDAAGHYARPDVFELRVHRAPRPIVRRVADLEEGEPV